MPLSVPRANGYSFITADPAPTPARRLVFQSGALPLLRRCAGCRARLATTIEIWRRSGDYAEDRQSRLRCLCPACHDYARQCQEEAPGEAICFEQTGLRVAGYLSSENLCGNPDMGDADANH